MRKGLVFTTDILIGATLVILILLIFAFYEFESILPEKKYEKLTYIAEDTMDLLAYMKARDIQNKPTVNRLIAEGVLTERDLDKSVLDLITSFWYTGNKSITRNISEEVLEGVTEDVCVNLTVEGEVMYSSCPTSGKEVAVATRIESGYMPGEPAYGYIARAWVTKVKKNDTKIFSIPMKGSSHGPGQNLFITKKFNIDALKIHNATFYISIHWGISNIDSDEFELNGQDLEVGDEWVHYAEKDYDGKRTQLGFDIIDVTDKIEIGWNELYIMLKTTKEHHAHIHPGSRIEVIYEADDSNFTQETERKIYFSNIVSEAGIPVDKKSGAWSIMPVYIPNDVLVKNVSLHLKGLDIDDTANKDIQVYLNNMSILKIDPIGPIFDDTIDLTENVSYGTNVLSVYLNCFINTSGVDEDFWGTTDTTLYSDPENDPDGSSYVYVEYEYEPELEKYKYGYIDIAISEELGGLKENPKLYSKSFGDINLFESFVHLAQLDSLNVSVYAFPEGETPNEVFQSPRTFNTPTDIYIYPNYLETSKLNYINMSDTCLVECDILPESSFEYVSLVPSQVGYGDVFTNESDAIENATQRLIKQLNEHDIDAEEGDIQFNQKSVAGIQWLWGPSLLKIIVWE